MTKTKWWCAWCGHSQSLHATTAGYCSAVNCSCKEFFDCDWCAALKKHGSKAMNAESCKCGHDMYGWHRALSPAAKHSHDCIYPDCLCSNFRRVKGPIVQPVAVAPVSISFNNDDGDYDFEVVETKSMAEMVAAWSTGSGAVTTSTSYTLNTYGTSPVQAATAPEPCKHEQYYFNNTSAKCIKCGAVGHTGWVFEPPKSTAALPQPGDFVSEPDTSGIAVTEPLKRQKRYPKNKVADQEQRASPPAEKQQRVALWQVHIEPHAAASTLGAIRAALDMFAAMCGSFTGFTPKGDISVECKVGAQGIYRVTLYRD